jgi:hypothetical protein
MPDIFGYEIVEAMLQRGCPLCRALAIDDLRWLDTFRREGRNDPGTRAQFFAAGGFCRHHAWLFHRLVASAPSTVAITDVYGWLAAQDLDHLEAVERNLARGRRRVAALKRSEPCPACLALDAAMERKAEFFVGVVSEPEVRGTYERSDGLCLVHLSAVFDRARKSDAESARFFLADWRRRLEHVRGQLADLERRRDYRYKDEPEGEEQHAWTAIIAQYVGEDFTDSRTRRDEH